MIVNGGLFFVVLGTRGLGQAAVVLVSQ